VLNKMLLIKTEYGNFGNFKDLYTFMIEEKIENVITDTSYIFDRVLKSSLTLEEVEELSK